MRQSLRLPARIEARRPRPASAGPQGRALPLENQGRQIFYDTTDAAGAATQSLPGGTWFIHTRLSLPFSELYWNVPVDPASTDTLRLTRGNAEERIKF